MVVSKGVGMGEKTMRFQTYTKNYRQLRKSGRQRGGLPQGRKYQFVVQCQIVNPEYINTNIIIQTEKVIFRSIYAYSYICKQ